MKLSIQKIRLDLKVPWKLSRNTSVFKENFIVTFEKDNQLFQSEVAPNIRYGETPEIIENEFMLFSKGLHQENYPQKLKEFNGKKALRFALESVYLSYLAKKTDKSLSEYLQLSPPKEVETSFSLPILEIDQIEEYLKKNNQFNSYKIKVNAQSAFDLTQAVHQIFPQKKLRIDGNEAWSSISDFLSFQEKVKDFPIEFIEQPFPVKDVQLYKELFLKSHFPIMADESLHDSDNLEELKNYFHAVNVKLMKAGGLIPSIELLKKAKRLGLKTMVGCMIESSLGIRYGMLLASLSDWVDLDGSLLLKNDPFQLITERGGCLRLN